MGTVEAEEVAVVSEEVAGRTCFITAGGAGVGGEVVAVGVRTGHNGRDGFGADLGFCCNRGIFLCDGAWHDGGGGGRDGRTCVVGGGGYSEIKDKLFVLGVFVIGAVVTVVAGEVEQVWAGVAGEVGLIDRGRSDVSSFGSDNAAEEAIVSGEAAREATLVILLFTVGCSGGFFDRRGGGVEKVR